MNNHFSVEKLKDFHNLIIEGYIENMDNDGNVLNKMKQFWSYFSFVFPLQKKVFKKIGIESNTDNSKQSMSMVIKVEIAHNDALSRLMSKLNQLDDVVDVIRL